MNVSFNIILQIFITKVLKILWYIVYVCRKEFHIEIKIFFSIHGRFDKFLSKVAPCGD